MTRPAVAPAATSSASRGFPHVRVVRAGRCPVVTPAEWRPAVARRPARPPQRRRTRTRAIPSGLNETGPERKGTKGKADARQGDACVSPSDASESPDRTSRPSRSSSAQTDEEPSFDWRRVGPGLAPSVATACLGAFLFGYHSAVINAPLGSIAADLGFGGDNAKKGAVVSVLVAGGFLGGLGIGPLADARGRRAALLATTLPLTLGTLVSASADSFADMTMGRLITGVGVGASSQIVPLYLSEVSPPNLRGTVNGIRRVAYVIGCLLAFQVAATLQRPPAAPPAEAPARRGAADDKKKASSTVGTDKVESAAKTLKLAAAAKPATAPEVRVAGPTGAERTPETTPGSSTNAPSSSTLPSVSNWSNWSGSQHISSAAPLGVDSNFSTLNDFLRTFGTDAALPATTPAAKEPAPTAPPPLPSPLEYPSAPASVAAEGSATAERPAEKSVAPGEAAATRPDPREPASASDAARRAEAVRAGEGALGARAPRADPSSSAARTSASGKSPSLGSTTSSETRASEAFGQTVAPPAAAAARAPDARVAPNPAAAAAALSARTDGLTETRATAVAPARRAADPPERKPEKLPPTQALATKAEARLETKPVRLTPAEGAKKASSAKKPNANAKTTNAAAASPPGWWRPLFYWAAAPAALLALSAAGGVAVESPVWLLGPEGCAVESRRSLAKLLNLRGRAAVRWQESVSGAVGRIAVGKAHAGRVTRSSGDSGDEDHEDLDSATIPGYGRGDAVARASTGEPAARSWSALFEERNRQPVIIGLGLCFLAAFSGSNTVIYFASSVLQEAGLTDPGLLTTAVGVPNLLGGLVALVATDAYGRRPLLLLSFGGMSVSLAALAIASAITPGVATQSFCALPVPSPEEFSGLPCVACDALAAICDDLPPPDYDGGFGVSASSASAFEPRRTVALIAIPAYTLLFSLGAGPVPWLLYNEVFPTRIRARATAVCTAINYASNTVVGATFLPLVGGIGLGGTYGLYAASCFAGFLFVDRFVFETKGLRLEDVEGVMAEREKKWRDE